MKHTCIFILVPWMCYILLFHDLLHRHPHILSMLHRCKTLGWELWRSSQWASFKDWMKSLYGFVGKKRYLINLESILCLIAYKLKLFDNKLVSLCSLSASSSICHWSLLNLPSTWMTLLLLHILFCCICKFCTSLCQHFVRVILLCVWVREHLYVYNWME